MAVDWVKLLAFLLIEMLSLSTSVILWDGFILSDSISISLMVLFIACGLWLAETSHWQKAVVAIIVGFFGRLAVTQTPG
jgi:multisubunit Na+/H+ antiporter MnhF subunit